MRYEYKVEAFDGSYEETTIQLNRMSELGYEAFEFITNGLRTTVVFRREKSDISSVNIEEMKKASIVNHYDTPRYSLTQVKQYCWWAVNYASGLMVEFPNKVIIRGDIDKYIDTETK